MIQTTDLSYAFSNSPAISFPNFQLDAGDSLLICGESGCGKSTLLHLLAGLRQPLAGTVTIDGDGISTYSAAEMDKYRGRNIGFVYQKSYLVQTLSIRDNLIISPYAKGKEKAKFIAERLGIEKLLGRFPAQLSVGQQQRVNIARAVINNPKLILADEPTSSLDNKNCSAVIELLQEEARSNNAALLIVTHDDRLRSEVSNCIELTSISHGRTKI